MKNIFESIGMSISHAVDCVVEKNRRSAQINRLKLVIRREERISEKAYIALGKYYYHNLRDENDPVTEPHCVAIDQASRRMDRAITRLEDLFVKQEQAEDACSGCDFDCNSCQGFCGNDEEEDFCCEEPAAPEAACDCCTSSAEEETCHCEENSCGCEEESCCEEPTATEEPSDNEEAPEAAQPPVESTYSGVEEAADPRDNREIPFQ